MKAQHHLKKILSLSLLATGALSLAQKAQATPTVNIFYPSAEIIQPKSRRVSSDILSRSLKTTTYGSGGLSWGLGTNRKGLLGKNEIGFDYVAAAPYANVSVLNRIRFNGKTQLYSDASGKTQIIAGFWGVGNKGNLSNNTALPPNVVYIMASRRFNGGVIQAGLAKSLANRLVVATPAGNSDRTYLQLGLTRALSRTVNIGVDYYSGKSSISALAPGVIMRLNDHAAFHLGYIRYNDSSIAPSRNQIYVLLDYVWGPKAEDGTEQLVPVGTPIVPPADATPTSAPGALQSP